MECSFMTKVASRDQMLNKLILLFYASVRELWTNVCLRSGLTKYFYMRDCGRKLLLKKYYDLYFYKR